MKIRTTERTYAFAEKIENEIPLYSLQDLTIDNENNFTAGIEAVEFDESETINMNSIFSSEEWWGKYCLCNQLDLPLHLLLYKHQEDIIRIYDVVVDRPKVIFYTNSRKSFDDFCKWFAGLKGTIQEKPLYEARRRKSFFDDLIESKGLMWGGNIDGFILNSDGKVECIVETRLSNSFQIDRYDPSRFFKGTAKKRGDYKTWEPLFTLASILEVPLFLLTFSRLTDEEKVGFATLNTMSKDEITYQDDNPNNNILEGIRTVESEFKNKLTLRPPQII